MIIQSASRKEIGEPDEARLEEEFSEVTIDKVERLNETESSEKIPLYSNAPVWRSALLRGGKALRHRNYRLFWTGQLISLIGTWMQNIGQGWLVLTLTNSPFKLGLVGTFQFLPVLILSLFSGALVDRLPKRGLIIFTQISSLFLALILAILVSTNQVQLWEIYGLALCLGVINSLDMPARQAFVPEMVAKEDLMNAVALNSSVFNAARVVGPAVAGILIGVVGIAGAFYINAASFIAVIIGLLMMRSGDLKVVAPRRQGSVLSNISEGLRYIRRTPETLMIIVVIGVIGIFGINFNVWMPVLARDVLNKGADGFGFLMSAIGLGALAAGIALAYMGKSKPPISLIITAATIFGLCEIGAALANSFVLTLILLAGVGAAMIVLSASCNTLLQLNTPEQLRGRVMSVYLLVFAGTTPIGNLLAGWLAHNFSTPVSMLTSGVLCFLLPALVAFLLKFRRPTARTPLRSVH